MSYDFLTTIVVINAIVTLTLLGKVWRKGPQLKKKFLNKLWRSEPIVPRHNPPKDAEYPDALEEDRLFFADFKDFADVVNWSLADEFTESRFRLQDLPDSEVRLNIYYSNGPTLGRSFAIYHNQADVGRLEIRPSTEYSTQTPEVYTSVEIDWARFMGFAELQDFLWDIATHVTSQGPNSNERIAAAASINSALTKTMWDHYRISQYDKASDNDDDSGELELMFKGTADFFVNRRDARARVAARRSA